MEGVTDYIYRRIHRRYFPGVDKYFTPFLSPTQNHVFPPRELRQVLRSNNDGIPLVPQLLTKNAADFLWAAAALADMGYGEVNLNVGCPSGTVTAKGKGAGLLADPDSLRRLLDGIFSAPPPVAVSVKTRLGVHAPEEFVRILEIFNDYPICQLILHARTRDEQYVGPVHPEAYGDALENARMPVCCNGDLRSEADIRAVAARFPGTAAVMLGRGAAADPAVFSRVRGEAVEPDALERFHRELCDAYCAAFGGPGSAMHRMKAIWSYLLRGFAGGEAWEKRLGRTRRWPEFLALTDEILSTLPPAPPPGPSPWQPQEQIYSF